MDNTFVSTKINTTIQSNCLINTKKC